MQVKAKFRCSSVTDENFGHITQRTAHFFAVYGHHGENADYSKATPSGKLEITIDKDTLAYQEFKPGKTYYLVFTEAED